MAKTEARVSAFLSLPSYMCIPNKGNNKNEILYK